MGAAILIQTRETLSLSRSRSRAQAGQQQRVKILSRARLVAAGAAVDRGTAVMSCNDF